MKNPFSTLQSPQASVWGFSLEDIMEKLEMVQVALRELSDVKAEEITAFVEEKFQTKIEPKFIPLFKASIQAKTRSEAVRQAARAARTPTT